MDQRLKEWREFMGWSQAQAAAALKLKRTTYQEHETNPTGPDEVIRNRAHWLQEARLHPNAAYTGLAHDLFQEALLIVREVDNMPKPGRPADEPDTYFMALDNLHKAAESARGHLINLRNRSDLGLLVAGALNNLVAAIDVASEARTAALEDIAGKRVRRLRDHYNKRP